MGVKNTGFAGGSRSHTNEWRIVNGSIEHISASNSLEGLFSPERTLSLPLADLSWTEKHILSHARDPMIAERGRPCQLPRR